MTIKTLSEFRLRNGSKPIKALALSYCAALGFAYIYAVANIALVVGLTPKDIAVHYYGAEKKIEQKAPEGEKTIDFTALESAPSQETKPQPSLKNLVTEGHFHLFGMSSFFFGLSVLGLFTGVKEKLKTVMVSLPFLLVIVDNLSFMATRFLGPEFSFLTAAVGSAMAVSFSWLWFAVVSEVLNRSEVS